LAMLATSRLIREVVRYPTLAEAPVDAATLIQVRRPEDEGTDLWNTTNRLQESLIRGGVSDHHRDKHGKLRSVRALRGTDSKVSLNKPSGDWRSRCFRSRPRSGRKWCRSRREREVL
jgi:hypothetical protein